MLFFTQYSFGYWGVSTVQHYFKFSSHTEFTHFFVRKFRKRLLLKFHLRQNLDSSKSPEASPSFVRKASSNLKCSRQRLSFQDFEGNISRMENCPLISWYFDILIRLSVSCNVFILSDLMTEPMNCDGFILYLKLHHMEKPLFAKLISCGGEALILLHRT